MMKAHEKVNPRTHRGPVSHFWSWPEAKQLNSKGSSALNTLLTWQGTALCLSLQTHFRFGSASYPANLESTATFAHPAPFTQSYQKYSRKSEKFSATMSSLKQNQGKKKHKKSLFLQCNLMHTAVRSHDFVTE